MDLRTFRLLVGESMTAVAAEADVAVSTILRIELGATPNAGLALKILRWADGAAKAKGLPKSARVTLEDLAAGKPVREGVRA